MFAAIPNQMTESTQLFDSSYTVYRQDRSSSNSSKSSGGGVLLAIRSCLKSRLLSPPENSSVEHLWVAVTAQKSTVFICVIYTPPDMVNNDALIDKHLEWLDWIVSQMGVNDNVIVLGDFNLRGIIWQRDSSGSFFPDSSCSSLSLASRKLLDAYNTAGLKQLNSVRNNNDRVLDLCFASEDICPDCSVVRAPSHLVKDVLHHPPLLLTAEIKPQLQFNDTTSQIFYDFSKADYDGMNVFLRNLNWTQILNGADANQSASLFSSILIYAISQFVPQKTQRKPTQPAWSNAHLKSLKRSKRAALRKHSKYRTDATRSAYAQANELYTRLNDRLYRAHQVEIQNSLKSNPKSFWRYVNDQRKQTGLPTSMTNGVDLEVSSVTGIADLFRSQFSSVFTNEILPTEDIDKVVRNVPHLSSPSLQVPVTSNMVINALDKLKCSTGFGPDCIPSVLLKKCSDSLAAPLAAIFNLSITSGEYPTCWKDSFVFPDRKSVV